MSIVMSKPIHLWINKQPVGADRPSMQIFETKNQLVAELMKDVGEGKRCFVVANSRKLVEMLAAVLKEEHEDNRRFLVVTSATTGDDKVQAYIADVKAQMLEYDVVLASPSIGTGIDISFPNKAKLVDAVFGFFETGVTNHRDCDQQLGRVRDPGNVKVWISPRRFNQETTFDVVKRDLLEDSLYKNLLRGFDADDAAVYDEEDEFIHMAAMVTSEDRASKNNLKQNLIEHKRRQGYVIEFVSENDVLGSTGKEVLKIGRSLTRETVTQALLLASPLTKGQFDDVREELQNNGSVSEVDKWAFHRTRLELFYREPLTKELIENDDEEKYRKRVKWYHDLTQRGMERPSISMLKERSQVVKSWDQAVIAMRLLLRSTPIFRNNQFDTSVEITHSDLVDFVQILREKKREFENLLDLDVRSDVEAKSVQQLSAVLKRIGLKLVRTSFQKIGGRKVYRYKLDPLLLSRVDAVCTRRRIKAGWQYVYESNGWDYRDIDDD